MCRWFICILTWVRVTRWSPPLAVCTCFVVSDRPSFRKSPSIRLEFGHSESHGARSLFVEPRQICQGYASLNGLPYGLVWLLTYERFSLLHRSALTQQGISHSYSIRLPCCSPSRPLRPKRTFGTDVQLLLPRADHLLYPAYSLSRVYVRPLSYSSPGSLAVTLVAIGRAVVSSRMRLPSFTVYLRVRYIFRIPTRYSSASAKCQAPRSLSLALLGAFLAFSSSVWRRFP